MALGGFLAHGQHRIHSLCDNSGPHTLQRLIIPCVLQSYHKLFFLALLASLMVCGCTTDLPTARLIVEQQSGETVTLKCVVESALDWRYKWFKNNDIQPFAKSLENMIHVHITKPAAWYQCKGETPINSTFTFSSNSVYFIVGVSPTDGHGSNQLAVGVTALVVGSVFTVFILKIRLHCFRRLRALSFCIGRPHQAPSSGQPEKSAHPDHTQAEVKHHVYETITEGYTEDGRGPKTEYVKLVLPKAHAEPEGAKGPTTVYVKLAPPKATCDYDVARNPQTVYAKLTPPKTKGTSSDLHTHFQVD